jgi:hypothetical protein
MAARSPQVRDPDSRFCVSKAAAGFLRKRQTGSVTPACQDKPKSSVLNAPETTFVEKIQRLSA